MTPSLFRALRGPIFLIFLGLLFAADQAGKFSLGQTWPALLILFGALKLFERFADRPRTVPPPNDPGPFPGDTYSGSAPTGAPGGPNNPFPGGTAQ